MTNDDILFRNALGILLFSFLCFGIAFRRRTHTGEKLDRLQEGWPILILLRLSGLSMWIALFAWLWDPSSFAWARLPFPAGFRWAGLAAGLVAMYWLIWMLRSLGKNLTDTVVTRKDANLVTNGPYRFVRHPMYVGVLMIALAVSLTASNWLFLVMGCAVFTMMCFRLPIEERNLIGRFGDQYRRYMQTTGRFFPKLV
jgi:protein-S-isoprenylcysteine O-methyltransferase Ste14